MFFPTARSDALNRSSHSQRERHDRGLTLVQSAASGEVSHDGAPDSPPSQLHLPESLMHMMTASSAKTLASPGHRPSQPVNIPALEGLSVRQTSAPAKLHCLPRDLCGCPAVACFAAAFILCWMLASQCVKLAHHVRARRHCYGVGGHCTGPIPISGNA